MAYRDDLAALEARHDALVAESARIERDLDDARERTKLRVLANIKVASPCSERWADMAGDDRIRSCAKCHQHVYNLSAMTRAEAERLIDTHHGRLCARYFQRRDGTILLADCEVGRDGTRRRRSVAVRIAAVLAAAGGSYAAAHTPAVDDESDASVSVSQGEVAVSPPDEPMRFGDDPMSGGDFYDPHDPVTGTPPLSPATPPSPELPLETHHHEPGLIEPKAVPARHVSLKL